jgi:pectate lyase
VAKFLVYVLFPANFTCSGGALMFLSTFFSAWTKPGFSLPWFLTICIASSGLWFSGRQTVEAADLQGFGATTPGGTGQTTIVVTNLNDSGAGSFRDALSQGNRTLVFNVPGTTLRTITLTSGPIKVKGALITIDGCSAPSPQIPGITLVNAGLYLSGTKGVHDVIIKCLRVRNAVGDGITVRDAAHHIVIDHVSAQGSTDGDIDVTRGASDVTVQWSILAKNDPSHNLLVLVDLQALRVTFHHNLFVKGQSRNPHTGWDGTLATTPSDTVADVRNNLIWDFSDYGTLVINNAHTNVVQNFYFSSTQSSADRALRVNSGGKAYAQGNFSPNIVNIDSQGNTGQPFPAAFVQTTDACHAAQDVVNPVTGAGVHPLDNIDQDYLSNITLPSCPQ